MKTFVFPGQGSQVKGMGGGLFDEFPEVTAKASEILGYCIKTLCLEDPEKRLAQTQFTQPALYTVNGLAYLKKLQDKEAKPAYLAGHSLGEYSALFAAGAFDFETGLRLVKKRGELMSLATGGGMAAIMGISCEKVAEILRDRDVDTIDVANFNAPLQTVIAGKKEEILRVAAFFSQQDVTYFPLNVSGAFHSRYMKPSSEEFARFVEGCAFSELAIPVVANVTARPYRQADLKKNLVEQITSPVKWTETVRYLMGKEGMEFEEIGPGNVLTRLVQTILREAEPLIEADEVQAEQEDTPVVSEASPHACDPEPVSIGSVTLDAAGPEKDATACAHFSPSKLGCNQFKKDYNLTYAYLAGSMYRGISSTEMVVRLAKAGMLGFFGAGGLGTDELEEAILCIQKELTNGEPYGINLLHNLTDSQREEQKVDILLKHGVTTIEASAFLSITPALIRFRAEGLRRETTGAVTSRNRIIAKVSRPEVAEAFLSPAPERLIGKMVQENRLTEEQARLLREIPVADDLCVEADSGGHTDAGVAFTLLPAMLKMRDQMMSKFGYRKKIRIGAAGGIGTPEAAAAAFVLGADFVLTGSINQCTMEAGTSAAVKDLLQQMDVQDTEYAPSGDLFELGAKVQVLKKGLFFPARANKLFELYRFHDSLEEIDEKTRAQLEEKYFRCSLAERYQELQSHSSPEEAAKAELNPKKKMALVFKSYFSRCTQLALSGAHEGRVDYQIHCGPALGAFNQWVKGTALEHWRNRHVDELGIHIMTGTAELLNQRFQAMLATDV
jgi:trans-AT polyketide synthase, acyltransferase and oxidoreductase domains